MKPADRLIVCLVAMVLGAPAGAALAGLLWPGQEAIAGGLAAFVLTIATVLAVAPRDTPPPPADHGYEPNGGKR